MQRVKKFYSDELSIILELKSNGNISGQILSTLKIPCGFGNGFSGVFVQKEAFLSLIFFTEWAGTCTCFTGEIFHYGGEEECLCLRYCLIDQFLGECPGILDCRRLLLFDSPLKNQAIETRKVLDLIPNVLNEAI